LQWSACRRVWTGQTSPVLAQRQNVWVWHRDEVVCRQATTGETLLRECRNCLRMQLNALTATMINGLLRPNRRALLVTSVAHTCCAGHYHVSSIRGTRVRRARTQVRYTYSCFKASKALMRGKGESDTKLTPPLPSVCMWRGLSMDWSKFQPAHSTQP
jgi:hypothetical protein